MNNKQQSNLMTLLGGAAGAYVGGPAGAMQGAQVGSMLGGMAAKPEVQAPQIQDSGTAIQRRMNQLNETPLRQIADSIDSLKYVKDPVQRQELAAPLMQAQYMAMQKGQV